MEQENNAAVDIIKKAKYLLDRAFMLNHEDIGFDVDVTELQEKIENYLNSIDNGWISIEDRLPNTGEYILTYSEKNGIQFQYFSMMYADAELPEWKENTSITHWQKLPQPPNQATPKESNSLSRKIPGSDIKYFKKREPK